jgi:hypothetical protein
MKNKPIEIAIVVLGCLLCAQANAQTPPEAADANLPAPVAATDLAAMSGGESPQSVAITSQTLSATNSGNTVSASSLVTGDVTLQSGAFNGFNGVGNFVFNTGNNNNLQGNLSVTIVTPR